MLQFHQNAKGFKRGDKLVVDGEGSLPLDQASRFQAFRSRTLTLAAGDVVRVTHNGFTADRKHRLSNGSLYRVSRFDERGNIVLGNGWTVSKEFGHLAYGYVVTSHASQGKSVDEVFVGQSSLSFPASSREQWYVSVSRAKKRVNIYTDDKEALREAIGQTDERVSATELINGKAKRQAVRLAQRDQDATVERQPQNREGVSHVQ